MTVIGMSRPEIDRVHILRDVVAERITVREAAQLLRITRRGVPITQGLSDRWSHGLGVAPARQAQQPLLPSGAADRGAGADHSQLCRFRPDARLREARRAARHRSGCRDDPALDGHGGSLAGAPAEAPKGAPAALSARLRRRTRPDRRLRALLVRGSRPTLHASGLH